MKGGLFGKCCDFSLLADEPSADGVIDELVLLARSHGLPLKRMNNDV
jgi:hypothetical protein